MSILQRLPTTKVVKVPELGNIEVIVRPISMAQFLDLAKSTDTTDTAIDLIINHIVDVGTKEELLQQPFSVFNALLEAIKEGSGVSDAQINAKKKS